MRYFFLLVLIVCVDLVCVDLRPLYAQGPSQKYLDMIGYEELLDLFNEYQMDPVAQERIILTYQKRAVAEGDTLKIARSYDRLARIFSPEKNIRYADSLISLTKNWDHITYPALGFILKGFEYGRLNNIRDQYEALNLALDEARGNSNISQQLYVLDLMIYLRATWGDVFKAIELQNSRHSILQSKNILSKIKESTREELHKKVPNIYTDNLISSYKSYVHCYVKSKNYRLAASYVDTIQQVISVNYSSDLLDEHRLWILDARTELAYWIQDYNLVLRNLKMISEMPEYDDFPRLKVNILLFGGLTHFELKNYDLSRFYLEKALDFYRAGEAGFFDSYDRLLYSGLSEIHSHFKNYDLRINFLNRLIEMDSISISNYKFIEPTFISNYETPRLLRSKEQTIQKLQSANKRSYGLIGFTLVIVLLSSYLAWKYYREKVVYRRRYERLMDRSSEQINKTGISGKPNKESSSVSDEVIRDIQRKLEKFEERKDYLNANINLMGLAKKFNTNSSYLSRVLNSSKSKNFSQYLNDLRIGHAVKQIKDDPVFRKYTIEAIALECGYNNSASFSRSFYKKTGLHPSYFINQVIKEKMV